MKYLISIFLFLVSGSVFAQNFEDDFSDGEFTTNPSWAGADSNFVVFNLDGNNVLRLNANQAGNSFLSTPSTNTTGEWEFFIRIDGSAPSDGNKAEIFIMSDIEDVSGAVNGYAVRVGQSGDDVFKLLRIDDGTQTSILEDTTIFEAGGSYRVKVTRDGVGNWTLEVGEGYHGELHNAGESVTDTTYSEAEFFGVLVTYTSTRVDDYYFDFKIDPPPVIIDPLIIESFNRFSNTEIDLSFNRDIDFATVSVSDFTLNGNVNPQSFSNQGNKALRITFPEVFTGGENELFVSGIESSNNDTLLTDTTFTFFLFDEYEFGDVIINEFLKDPPTGSGISEYVELKNTTQKVLNLKNWRIGDNNSLTAISDEDIVFYPDSFLVVTTNPEGLTSNFGAGLYVDVSLPALNNTTDQIRVFDGSGALVDSLEYTTTWGGEDVALERKSIELSSTLQANWGDSPNAIGTPGKENEVEVDTTPPDIESYEFLNDSTIQLVFTEEIKQGPAENPDNYEILILVKVNPNAEAGENEYVKATLLAPDTVLLEFDRPYYSYRFGNYLEIRNQEDVFGNIAETISISYELVRTSPAIPGDVVINEFMFDPATGYSEFIELNSHTGKTLNLNGWTISDNTGSEQIISEENLYVQKYLDQTSPVEPNPYVLLTPDSTIPGLNINRIVMGSRFPTLNNSTDAIVLKNAEGITIDSLTYSSIWGGEEVSLERRDAEVSGVFQANWGDSPSPNFGTPGLENAIEPDTEAPFITQSLAISNQEVRLIFSEVPTIASLINSANYSVSPGMNITQIIGIQDTVKLTFETEFSDGQEFEITVMNTRDIFGNKLTSQTVPIKYVEISMALKQEVVINEILYRRKNELSPEFVELFNNTEKNFDLSGWTFKDASSSKATIPTGTFLAAGEYVVLTDREDFANSLNNGIYLSGFPSLNDSGDEIIIKNVDGITIDSLFYQSMWGGNSPGISVERKDPARASNDASNWNSSTAQNGFSAGSQSSIYEEDETPPEIIFAAQIDSVVKIVFSEFVDPDDQTVFFVNEISVELLETGSNLVYVEWAPGPISVEKSNSQANLNVEVYNLKDTKGNVATDLTSPLISPLAKGSIVINEIMFDPLADSDDNLPDQTEYIELFNGGTSAISLEGISLHDAPDEEDEIRSLFPVSTQFKWIQPNGYFLIYSEDEAETFNDSKTARYFSMEDESDQFTMRIDRSSLSLASTGDAIYLADSIGVTIDSVFFDESWQNPNVFDTDGIALERINPEGESNSESNWSSSTHVSGGTPNTINSIFQRPGTAPASTGISFTPNPFSPDDDGFEDNLYINYTLDAPDYLLRVRIFDRYGREVRKLVDGQQTGFEGSLLWDGLTDDRKKNRVGIYIVLFEAYNSANGSDRTFKETVVLARMF
ncbi:MAG: lamin tail domain-containing protein [Balneolaceae bacterium]